MKEDDKIPKHYDFDYNKKWAEEFAEQHDPFRRPSVQEQYDPVLHSVIRIQASDYCIFFSMIPAKSSKKHVSSHPVNYNVSHGEFSSECENTLRFFKDKYD